MPFDYDQDKLSAFDAITAAQQIAFAPMLFQAAMVLRDSGVLAWLEQQGKNGATIDDLVAHSKLSSYALGVLLDMALSGRIVYQQRELYFISKIGHFICSDTMTRVNMDFVQHLCYQGMVHLYQALISGKPTGLSVFGDWPTIYPALSQLPEPARSSWFAFDHYYSSSAFSAALPHVMALKPAMIYDAGGNSGKWALQCCEADHNVRVTILDLPEQIVLARQAVAASDFASRIDFYALNILADTPLPDKADIWWMSQFLDCFSPSQIITILQRVSAVMAPGAYLCIMELFWDAQRFEAATFSLNASSLYFACMANGYSRFYSASVFFGYLQQAGFQVCQRIDHLGVGHTLLICQKQQA